MLQPHAPRSTNTTVCAGFLRYNSHQIHCEIPLKFKPNLWGPGFVLTREPAFAQHRKRQLSNSKVKPALKLQIHAKLRPPNSQFP